jgi:Leucine-rich repeat (LRR) protein
MIYDMSNFRVHIRLQLLLCHLILITTCTNLKCKFKNDFVWNVYGCDVTEWIDETENNGRIESIEGQHLPDHTEDDVLSLHLENTQYIQRFTNDVFSKFKNLRYLVIHSTTLKFLLRGDFLLARDLINIHITHNEITALEDYCFLGTEMLKTLNLRENKIGTVTKNAFKGLTALKFLTLTLNEIESLHETTFNDQIYLELLSLSSNKIRHIDERLFSKNRNLEVLFVDNNQLTFIDGRIFDNNLKLREIYMDNNRIKYILNVQHFLVNLKDLEVAVFSNNKCIDIMLFIMNRLHPIYTDVFQNCSK